MAKANLLRRSCGGSRELLLSFPLQTLLYDAENHLGL